MLILFVTLILSNSNNFTNEIEEIFDDDFNETNDDMLNGSLNYHNYFDDGDLNFSYEAINCSNPHSHKNEYGYCDCDDGYSGDPESSRGCYKCSQNCTTYAECVYPGVCECMYGYIGNGTVKCELAIPKIVSLSPNFAYLSDNIIVNVSYSYPFHKPYSAYCKFGDYSLLAESITENLLICRAPHKHPQKIPVSISFDGIHYSKVAVDFEYRSPFSFVSVLYLSTIYIVLIAVITLCLFVLLRKRGKHQDIPTKEEKEPFFIDPENPQKKKRKPKIPRKGY